MTPIAAITDLLRFCMRHSADRAVLTLDDDGRAVSGIGFGQRFGAAAETDLAGRTLQSLYAPTSRDLCEQHLAEVITAGTCLHEIQAEGADMRPFLAEIRIERLADVAPDGAVCTCILTDISERGRAEAALRAMAEERLARDRATSESVQLRQMLDGIAPAMLVLDREWRALFFNERARDMLRLGDDDGRRRDLRRRLNSASSSLLNQIERVLAERVPLQFEEHYPLSGAWFEVQATPIPAGVCLLFRDISESRHQEEQLTSLALFEPLTSLPNRALFLDRAAQAVANAHRANQLLSVIVVDLELQTGRRTPASGDAADMLVRDVAERLGSYLRRSDTLAQIGPTRFAVVQNALSRIDGAATYASKLLGAVADTADTQSRGLRLAGRVGIAVLMTDGVAAEDLLRAAEAASEQATGDGASRYRFANADLDRTVAARRKLEAELRDAIILEQFRVNYQPVIDLPTGTVAGLESLLRWTHPTGRIVPADEFLAVADEMGLSDQLAGYVLREVCEQITAWMAGGLDVPPVSINIAEAQIRSREFATALASALKQYNLDPSRLQIEMPEALLVHDAANAEAFVQRLREMGVNVLIDDFGSGAVPFAALARLPLGGVKAAVSLLAVDAPLRGLEVLRQLARSLGWSVVLKGIESGTHLDWLSEAGMLAQGYHLGPPTMAGDITPRLRPASGNTVSMR